MALAVIVGWAGLHRAEPIEILGIKTTRSDAFVVASSAFVLANLAILVALLRMGDLLSPLNSSDFTKGVERVMTHSSLFNPFAYFGPGLLSRLHSGTGFVLLLLCWWICYASISTLLNLGKNQSALEAALLVVGILSLLAIHRFQAKLLGRLHEIDPDYAAAVMKANRVRSVLGTVVGIIGLVVFFEIQWRLWK